MPDIANAMILVGADLEGAGPYINTKAQQIVGELHRLRSDLAPLIEEWIAQSATAYQDRMHEWDVAAVGLFGDREDGGILGTIAQAMNINYQNYVATEEANLQTWQSSAGGGGAYAGAGGGGVSAAEGLMLRPVT